MLCTVQKSTSALLLQRNGILGLIQISFDPDLQPSMQTFQHGLFTVQRRCLTGKSDELRLIGSLEIEHDDHVRHTDGEAVLLVYDTYDTD